MLHSFLRKIINSELDSFIKKGILNNDSTIFEYTVEAITNKKYGDISTNIAMYNSKNLNIDILEFAEKLKYNLDKKKQFQKIEVVKPGFINFFFEQEFWFEQLKYLIKDNPKKHYLDKTKKKINIEFVSANPTGQIHIGHARGAVLGDVIASILKEVGHDVTKEYYINDAGNQIEILFDTIKHHIFNSENKSNYKLPEYLYPGEYLQNLSQQVIKKFGKLNYEKKLNQIKKFVMEKILKDIKRDLNDLGVIHDVFTSEKKLIKEDNINKIINLLSTKNLIYTGYLEKPKSLDDKNWQPKKQILFKSEKIGDESDRTLIKSNGETTYFMSDIIYHVAKIKNNYDQMINIWGADHHGYVARVKNVIGALYDKKIDLTIFLTALVNLIKNKKIIKMSKRKGTFITLKEVLDEVGKDNLRFMMISRSQDKVIDFDFDLVKLKSRENPVFYVKYAHARCSSIIKIAKSNYKLKIPQFDKLYLLTLEEELVLIKKLSYYYNTVISSAKKKEPHILTNYLYDLSKIFHSYWSLGNTDFSKRIIINEDTNLTAARINLVFASKKIIKSGLEILNIEAPEEM